MQTSVSSSIKSANDQSSTIPSITINEIWGRGGFLSGCFHIYIDVFKNVHTGRRYIFVLEEREKAMSVQV